VTSVHWLDPTTGAYASSAPVDLNLNDFVLTCPGLRATVIFDALDWFVYGSAAGGPILRLRQSPRSNPTRIGQNPTLRARQKFV